MLTIFSNIIAAFITIPLLALIVIYWVSAKVTKNKRKALHLTRDGGAIVFIFAVHYLILVIWEISILWMIIILLLLLAIFIMFLHYKKRGDIEFKRVQKVLLRLCFIIFFLAYLILLIYGLIHRIFM